MIQPLLTRYSGPGDCLGVDYKSVLINYMVRNDLQYGQDARWSDLATRSEFEGETTPTIIVIIMTSLFSSRNHSHVSPKTPRQGRHLDHSPIMVGGQEAEKEGEEHEREEKIIEFYQFLQKKKGNLSSC